MTHPQQLSRERLEETRELSTCHIPIDPKADSECHRYTECGCVLEELVSHIDFLTAENAAMLEVVTAAREVFEHPNQIFTRMSVVEKSLARLDALKEKKS